MFLEQIKAPLMGDALIKSMTITKGEFLDLFWESERQSREQAVEAQLQYEACQKWVISQYLEKINEMYRNKNDCDAEYVGHAIAAKEATLQPEGSLWQRIKGWFK